MIINRTTFIVFSLIKRKNKPYLRFDMMSQSIYIVYIYINCNIYVHICYIYICTEEAAEMVVKHLHNKKFISNNFLIKNCKLLL